MRGNLYRGRRAAAGWVLAMVATAGLSGCGGGGDGGEAGLGQAASGGSPPTAGSIDDQRGGGAATTAPVPAAENLSGAAAREAVRVKAASLQTGQWGAVLPLPLVPASAANLPDGRVLLWAANDRFSFATVGQVYSTLFDPVTGTATAAVVKATGHNMFCPGTTNLPDGRILVNGGSNAAITSIYDPATGNWSRSTDMLIARGYEANTLLRDGRVLTLGGSWSGDGAKGKNAELWSPTTGWSLLTGVAVDTFLTKDPAGVYRADNHMWLLPTGNGKVFHAGPSARMHWIDTTGSGRVVAAGTRGDDADSMSGNAVMYDAGKILKVGGSPAYQESNATASAQLIDIRAVVKVRRLAPMAYARAFHNSVVLPNGQVVVVGGQSYPIPFNDGTSVLTAELWDPVSETFTRLPAMKVPRNYHSVALLLPDARVLSAGGGLCGQGCAANHADAQIFSPHYLFNADGTPAVRPVITTAPAAVAYGKPMEVRTDGAVAAFSLVRLSSTTHTVNNDQRRVALRFERSGENAYAVSAPTNPGWALPGLYMLFAMNEQGVPSVARTVRLTGEGTPTLAPVDDQFAALGRAVSLKLAGPGGARLDVTGLPAGLSFDASAATISGAPAVPGSFSVTVLATNDVGTTSTDFLWQVDPQGSARFVKLEQLSEIKNNIWGSMAELNLLGPQGETLDRAGWKISASSEERVGEDGSITNAIDGKPGTYWHSRYSSRAATVPHSIVVDLGRAERLGGLRYLPRAGGGNGTMARFRVFVSADGANWGDPVAEGDFRQINASAAAEKTVRFSAGSDAANQAPVLAAQPDMRSLVGERVLLDLVASDDQFEPLAFAATNLPPGLTLRADTGMISGVLQTAGRHAVTVTVSDRQGITASMSFAWQVMDLPPPTPSVAAPVAVAGTATRLVAQLPATLPGLSYAWDFGDGASAPFVPSPETSHVYAAPGIYSVTLQVRGADGQVTVYRFAQAVAGGLATASAPASSSSLGWLPSTDGKTGQLWAVMPMPTPSACSMAHD